MSYTFDANSDAGIIITAMQERAERAEAEVARLRAVVESVSKCGRLECGTCRGLTRVALETTSTSAKP